MIERKAILMIILQKIYDEEPNFSLGVRRLAGFRQLKTADPGTLNLLFGMPKLAIGLQIGPKRGAIAKCSRQLDGQFRADTGPPVDDSGHIRPGHTKALCKLGNGQVALFHEEFLQDSPWMSGG
jgi:hypothetical protein